MINAEGVLPMIDTRGQNHIYLKHEDMSNTSDGVTVKVVKLVVERLQCCW